MMPISEQDLTLLSSYLDGQLTERERASLEARLSADASLRAEIESLRATVSLLRQAERLRVPRNFTLDPKAHGKPAQPSLWQRFGFAALTPLAGAASMIAAVMICAGGFVLASGPALQAVSGEAGSPAVVAQNPAPQLPFAAGAAPLAATEAP